MNRLSVIKRGLPWALSFSLVSSLLLAVLGAGCRVVQTAADFPSQTVRAATPGRKDKHAVDPVEVQQTLLRFADEYSTQMALGADKFRRGTNVAAPAEILKWKVALTTETCSMASGPNAVVNLLDLTVFVTVMRMAIEEHWQPNVFHESALPLLETTRSAETEIWRLAATVLTSEQQAELHRAIDAWRTRNPSPENMLAARAIGFTAQLARLDQADAVRPGSVFSLLRMDPLAGMDPAVRELAQARLFAERALYVAQQMPMLLRWQTELLTVNAMETPAVRQLVTNSTQLSSSVERFARVAEQLPAQISSERVAILKTLESQEQQLMPMVSEMHQTLAAGTRMSASLNTTINSFDALMKRFGIGETNKASVSKTNTEPFRILDYAKTAAQLEGTARQLTEFLVTLDRTIGSTNLTQLSAQIGPAVQQTQHSGREIVNYAFWKALLLVAVVLVAALAYRFVSARLTPSPRPIPL